MSKSNYYLKQQKNSVIYFTEFFVKEIQTKINHSF